MNEEKIVQLVKDLMRYDNKDGYKLSYQEAEKKLESSVNNLSECEEDCLEYVHPLLTHEETWSSVFALRVLGKIKSAKSVSHLIKFIKDNENGYYGDYCEEAMFALNNIGCPAIAPLIKEIKEKLDKKEFFTYLIGSLTGIKDEKVYSFMVDIVRDYIKNEEKYDEWFCIDQFTHDFNKQGKKEVLPLLKEILSLDRLSNRERIEVEDTAKIIEDPTGWEKECEENSQKLKPLFEKFMKEEKENNKLSKKEQEKIQEAMSTPDDDFEIQFKCHNCNKKQNVKPGLVWDYGTGKNFSFDNEIMCKFCFSNNIKLTRDGEMEIMWKAMRVYSGDDNGIMYAGDTIIVENKKVGFKKSYPYILKRIKEEPNNGELYLRAGNVAEKTNRYDEAIKYYEKSLELSSKLIASYMNLVEIYEYRYNYYKIKDAKQNAIFFLEKMMKLFMTQDFNTVTIRNKNGIVQFIGEKSESLGINFPGLIKVPNHPYKKEKVGRNEPCLCGSGKKYKKCCLNKDEDSY